MMFWAAVQMAAQTVYDDFRGHNGTQHIQVPY